MDTYASNEVPIVLIDGGGHTALLSQKAIEHFDIKNKITVYGTDAVKVDQNGDPTGYLVEIPRFDIMDSIPISKNDIKDFICAKQEVYIAQGYTSIVDAAIIETEAIPLVSAYEELAREGKLRLKIRALCQISETEEDPLALVDEIAAWAKRSPSEYFQIVGIKIFLDGVPEALTSWTSTDYFTKSKGEGYRGFARWNDDNKDQLIQIIKKANAEGLLIHMHSMGEAATSFALDCFEAAREGTADDDTRNALAHLSYFNEGDLQRLVSNKITACIAPQWTPWISYTKGHEIGLYGEANARKMYPMKSLIDAGVTAAFHTDGMCPQGVPAMIFMARTQIHPMAADMDSEPRNARELLSATESLHCMTTTAAYSIREEANLGSIEAGKSADFVVYDKDFTDDTVVSDISALDAKLLASVSSGKTIYSSVQ